MTILSESVAATMQANGMSTTSLVTPKKNETGNDPKENLWYVVFDIFFPFISSLFVRNLFNLSYLNEKKQSI